MNNNSNPVVIEASQISASELASNLAPALQILVEAVEKLAKDPASKDSNRIGVLPVTDIEHNQTKTLTHTLWGLFQVMLRPSALSVKLIAPSVKDFAGLDHSVRLAICYRIHLSARIHKEPDAGWVGSGRLHSHQL